MAISGAAVGYCAIGGVVLYSGIKGSSLSDTAKAVLAGNLSVADTEGISGASSAGSNLGSVASGTATQNYLLIANYLVGNGYSKAAAAGITGCIAGESKGNPESVGDHGTSFGLIQEHGAYSGLVTGNASADLQAQLPAIIAYNNAQGANLIGMLNQIGDPVQAADFYSQHFERPAVTDSDVRANIAQQVYNDLSSSTASQNGATP
jgi:Phage tail lysozyme